jgi:hypothetical protein
VGMGPRVVVKERSLREAKSEANLGVRAVDLFVSEPLSLIYSEG